MRDIQTNAPGGTANKRGMPEGKGFRPSFNALWHLRELRVAETLEPFESEAWKQVAESERPPVRIAVIDTPVAYRHPNLVGAIDLGLARDFSVFDTGAFVVPDPREAEDRSSRLALARKVRRPTSPLQSTIRKELARTVDRSAYVPAPYGAHGTAIAGLIGARPAKVKLRKTAYLQESGQGHSEVEPEFVLPYAGVNPFCRIVPISTTAAPNPQMIRAALEYAWLIEAEIVVIAAEWADEIDRSRDPGGWQAVDEALLALSGEAQVFCAAGNLNADALSYPASLSGSHHRHRPWAVTACDETGRLLTYAPPLRADRRMVACLSTEHPRYDRDETRLDPYEARDPDILLPPAADDYPPRHIVATDPPGRWGYNPSKFEHDPTTDEAGEHYEIGSLFCRFSGTSTATALAAGLASLALVLGPPDKGGGSGHEGDQPPPKPAPAHLFTLDRARAVFGQERQDSGDQP